MDEKMSLLVLHEIQVLCQEVHAATVLSLLVVADRHEASELKSTCVKVGLPLSLNSRSPVSCKVQIESEISYI